MFGTIGLTDTTGSGTIRVALGGRDESAAASGAAASVARVPLSPRIKADPVAGVMIAEYLTTEGEKQIQIPSQTVVAYLRSGLTASGLPEKEGEAALSTDA
ncbi:MAG: hypothetical protein EOM37_08610 [Proteobacteria bacterium]|nr:hypothetical protein [Alphaproteobacteria bacterium]NCC04088.1 hypothetical protein [Pseudomonadota bacterium]